MTPRSSTNAKTRAARRKQKPAEKSASPPQSQQSFLIAAIGASAGGMEAFSELLRNLPTDSGMAFILIQHLDPTHQSALAGLLSKDTSMKVIEVTHPLVQHKLGLMRQADLSDKSFRSP